MSQYDVSKMEMGWHSVPINADGLIRIVRIDVFTLPTKTIHIGGKNLAVAELNDGHLALAYAYNSSCTAANATETTVIGGKRFALSDATSQPNTFSLVATLTGNSTTVTGTLMLDGVRLALNASGDLVVADSDVVDALADAFDYVEIGSRKVQVARIVDLWWLVLGII